mmetsp:Transcript_11071/g.16938  ORF Transcript_11071/g.16938 Transcript_11071/m.16938 type:complete len:158 (+) Transcript_11071:210-683(+)
MVKGVSDMQIEMEASNKTRSNRPNIIAFVAYSRPEVGSLSPTDDFECLSEHLFLSCDMKQKSESVLIDADENVEYLIVMYTNITRGSDRFSISVLCDEPSDVLSIQPSQLPTSSPSDHPSRDPTVEPNYSGPIFPTRKSSRTTLSERPSEFPTRNPT